MTACHVSRWMGLLAVMAAARADTLLQQGYIAPGAVKGVVSGSARNHIRFRTEALVHAGDSDVIQLTARCVKIGRYDSPLTLELLPARGQTGEPVTRTVLAGETADIAFPVKPGTLHRLVADARRNAYSLECRNGRLAFPAELGGTAFYGIGKAAPVHFFVPKGARKF